MATQYQKIPVPGFDSPTGVYSDPEILYSTAGFTQKGITIAAGQGVLAAGTVMGQRTSDKKYYAYNAADTPAGTNVARGILRRPTDTGLSPADGDQVGNLVIQGIVKYSMVVGLDSDALTDLGATPDTLRGTLKL